MATWLRRISGVALSALLLAGCAGSIREAPAGNVATVVSPPQTPPAANDVERYKAAILDAAVATRAKALPLLPVPRTDPVTVAIWTRPSDPLACTNGPACALPRLATTPHDDWTWVTVEQELKDRCASWNLSGPDLARRVGQLLGLQPGDTGRLFAILAVRPSALKRPCLSTASDPEGRPICSLTWGDTPEDATRASRFTAQQMAWSYYFDEGTTASPRPAWGYPFTRLGYTYDWAADARPDHYGASEFVLPPGTAVTLINRVTTDEYCRK